MTTEHAAEVFTVINFAVIGLSHLVQPRVWVEFFYLLRAKGQVGAVLNGMLSLMVGSIIVSLHNVWELEPGLLVTLLGWSQVLKGLGSLIVPSYGMKGMMRVSMERAYEFQLAGGLFLILSAVIAWSWRA